MLSKRLLYIIPVLCMALASCGDDDVTNGSSNANVNANTTDKSMYATRLEVPQLHKGNNYQLLVKYDDSSIGVNYMIEWDCLKRAQRWSCWQWTKSNTYKGWERGNWKSGCSWHGVYWKSDPFQPDEMIEKQYRSELADYSGSNYNRGHICASEDRICSQEVNGQTFYLSNMQPQIYNFNGKVWATMESKVRKWRDAVLNAGGTMYICKGGTIYDVMLNGKTVTGVLDRNPETGLSNSGLRIPVPKYFFMAVLKQTAVNTFSAMAFWAEHKPDDSRDLTPYMISIDELERRTGYDFFCNLPDNVENSVESMLTTSDWK